jgi:NADH-quinone oxidoreductase subunit E
MAWITKNSASLTIERRKQPYLDDQMKEQLERDVLPKYPTRRAAIMSTLHAIQEKHGYVPHQAMEEAADFLGLSAADVFDTLSFYEEYATRPRGKYVIWICRSIACEITGQPALLARIREKLNIEPGETTPDGKYTLMEVECLGVCSGAPAALINEKIHENLSADNIDSLLDSLE